MHFCTHAPSQLAFNLLSMTEIGSHYHCCIVAKSDVSFIQSKQGASGIASLNKFDTTWIGIRPSLAATTLRLHVRMSWANPSYQHFRHFMQSEWHQFAASSFWVLSLHNLYDAQGALKSIQDITKQTQDQVHKLLYNILKKRKNTHLALVSGGCKTTLIKLAPFVFFPRMVLPCLTQVLQVLC